MNSELKYQVITDEEITDLFKNTCFGSRIDESLVEKRLELIKWVKNKRDHYWVGHTAFYILVSAGLVKNYLPVRDCIPTIRGLNLIKQGFDKGKCNE